MKKISVILFALLIVSCTENNKNKQPISQSVNSTAKIQELKMPAIPMAIVEPMERASYLAGHYWDNLSFDPIQTENDTSSLEQYFSNYLAILNESNKSTLEDNIRKSLTIINTDSVYLAMFNHLSDKYLYDPNSPFRNDELYLMFVNAFKDNPMLSYADRERLKFKYALLQKNRIGHKAENFSFMTDEGGSSLSKVKADLLLLYFNNPGCHACEEVQAQLQASDLLNDRLDKGKLTVLSIYPDEDLTEWEKHKNKQPKNWINGYDSKQDIKTGLLYDLKAIPTIYLLDNNKNVILKDATVQQLESYIYEHQ